MNTSTSAVSSTAAWPETTPEGERPDSTFDQRLDRAQSRLELQYAEDKEDNAEADAQDVDAVAGQPPYGGVGHLSRGSDHGSSWSEVRIVDPLNPEPDQQGGTSRSPASAITLDGCSPESLWR